MYRKLALGTPIPPLISFDNKHNYQYKFHNKITNNLVECDRVL